MRKPTVKNKYNLTIKDIKKLKIGDRSKIIEPLFWRNDVISAWCILERIADNEFWLGIYDDDAPAYKGKIRIEFTCCDGMCSYKFNKFFKGSDIGSEADFVIQEKALRKINELIDEEILKMTQPQRC